MKKVLIVAQSLSGGGTEVALTEFINHLDIEKYNITLLLLDNKLDFSDRIKRDISIKYVQFDTDFWHNLVSMNSTLGKVIKKAAINKKIKIYDTVLNHVHSSAFNINYDLAIDFYGYGSFTTAIVAKKISACKKATWLHDAKMPWIKNVEKYFKYYDKIFGVSKTIKTVFDTMYPAQSSKCEVLYNFIDKSTIKNKSTKFIPKEFNENDFKIVSVGRLTEQKGFDIALKAASILKEKKIKFKWFVVGDGRDKKKLDRILDKLGLNNYFFFLGAKKNPYPYIKYSDIFVLPSRHEGYGIAILEARILKKPVITSNIPVSKEQIINKKNGLIANLEPIDLSKCILEFYNDEKLRNRISAYLQNESINFDGEIHKIEKLLK